MRRTAIIQARMGSSRLPGKVLMPIGPLLALEWCLVRTRGARLLDSIIVATSDLSRDDQIVEFCHKLNVVVTRGSESDVLQRYYDAALQGESDIVVRITADCPFIDPQVIDYAVAAFIAAHPSTDYLSNVHPRTYPQGLDVEVFSAKALKQAALEASDPYAREHVTPYFYQNPNLFRLASVQNGVDYSQLRWVLDTAEDLEYLRQLYTRFKYVECSWQEILRSCQN